MYRRFFFIALLLGLGAGASSQSLTITPERTLNLRTFGNGDRIPDYSYCGYMASDASIPFVEAKIKVTPQEGDATEHIQRAIDYVSAMPMDANGFRGAIQLEAGSYRLEGSLQITQSGVVLRGSGYDEKGTELIAAGTDRATLIRILGKGDKQLTDSIPVAAQYVPLSATVIPLSVGHGIKSGERIVLTRPSTKQWIEKIGADKIGIYVDYPLTPWSSGDYDIRWERTVIDASPTSITIDVPLTNSLDPELGGGFISRLRWDGRIRNVGIENLRLTSEYNPKNKKDENHRWMAITVENAEDGWVRRVTGKHFVSSIVAVWESVRRFTIEDCKSLEPVGEIGGYRRYAFQTTGQQILFQRCYAEYGFHDFSVSSTAAGPNAFVQCYSYHPYSFSGTLGGWTSGTLFDRVTIDGNALKIAFRDVDGQGGGWSGANSLCWETRAPQVHIDAPPGAYNWAFGTWGQGYGNGNHEMPRTFLQPRSFFYAQWGARTGRVSNETNDILYVANPPGQTDAVHTAFMNKRSELPELIMEQWIDTVTARHPFALTYNVRDINDIAVKKSKQVIPAMAAPVEIINGRIVQGGKPLSGRTQRTALWRGNLRPSIVASAGIHLSRFVPGKEGNGFTDNIDSVAVQMQRRGIVALNHFPALWYERRRDDHGRSRRVDADVWAPFYEQPFSRSGIGEAFDRLSKYNLDEFNPWYWNRVKQFAEVADRNGLLLIQDHYLQHNIIEEGAHWADYPWRTANNINNLEFPENVFYAGDKRVFMANHFYDTTHAERRKYHILNIRKHLDELGDHNNVIHHLGLEYTGPAHFIRFWLDVIRAWEQETGKNVKTMLSATKDMLDEILADPAYASQLDIIDIRQWHYRTDGSLYSPQGGVSLTQRQYARIMDVGQESLDGVYRAISEYRLQYPDKVIVYNKRSMSGWVPFIAGASLCSTPRVTLPRFYEETAEMLPVSEVTLQGKQWGMGTPSVGYVIYTTESEVTIDLRHKTGNFKIRWIDPRSGEQIGKVQKIVAGNEIVLQVPTERGAVVWLSRR
ncbi:pectate lyase [Bacteroides sp. 214]|uniref:DUF6298 domain-containing protein n=1 Tax=Bacteroides sp. 214 TaxID=2302935 RepID=UPI0013D4B0CE|nr:DUF6298 domain-containing protein [Bacteroides sp. 214]NDW12262.1 pectate lyase [Bacteroides sp. 214]